LACWEQITESLLLTREDTHGIPLRRSRLRELPPVKQSVRRHLHSREPGTRRCEYTPAGLSPSDKCDTLPSLQGFNYSVDLYDADVRIAIEVEKSERKNVSDDLLKFQKGYRTQKDSRPKIEFGCLILPVNYLGRHNLYQHSLTKFDFMKGVLFIDDVVVIGYRDPRPD